MNDDYTPEQWAQIHRNAKAAMRRDPKDEVARAAFKAAETFMVSQRRAATQAEKPPAGTDPSGAALVGAAQGATFGLADEILGAMQAIGNKDVPLTRPAIDSTIAATRNAFNDSRMENPGSALLGNVAGSFINPANRLLGPLTQNVGPAAKGAVYGATYGGLQGAGESAPGQRLVGGAVGAAAGGGVGLIMGYGGGKVSPALGQMWRNLRGAFRSTEQQVAKALGPRVAPEAAQAIQESAHRAFLVKEGYPPHAIERLMETWRAGGKLPPVPPVVNPPVETPVAIRPGEILVQRAPREFEVHGTRATPPVPTAPTILEMQTGQSSLVSPRDAGVSARAAFNLTEAAGGNATEAARRAAGTYSNWDPRQALILMLLAGQGRQRP